MAHVFGSSRGVHWFVAATILATALAAPSVSQAATCTWTGATSNLWSVATNWSGCGDDVPQNGDSLVFPAAASEKNMTNDIAGLTITHMAFMSSSYFLFGNSLTLTDGLTADYDGPFGSTIATSVNLVGAQTFTVNGPFSVAASPPLTLSMSDGLLVVVNGDSRLTLRTVTGAGGIVKNGTGTLQLMGTASTYTGLTTIHEGTVRLIGSGGLGAGGAGNETVVNAGGTLRIETDGLDMTVNEPITLAGGTLFGTCDPGNLACSADSIHLTANSTIRASVYPFTVLGPISGGFGVTIGPSDVDLDADLGTSVVFSGTSSYTGQTTIQGGTLIVTGSIQPSLVALVSGVLGGTGTTGAVSGGGGTVSPGVSPGNLNVGNFQLGSDATLAVEIDGANASQYDRVTVTGTVTLNSPVLAITLGFVPAPAQEFVIIDNDGADPVMGTFAGLSEGATLIVDGQQFSITYAGGTGNDVVLVAQETVPVPVMPTLWLMVLGLLLAGLAARSRRTRLA